VEQAAPAFSPEIDEPGPYTGRGNDNEWGARHADLLSRLMQADLKAVGEVYDRAAVLEVPGGKTIDGHTAADRFWIALRSSLPTAEFEIHHMIGREDPKMPPRSAIRWSLHGTHDGWGAFGAPTGKKIYVMGINHAEWGPWGLRREWVNYDEVAIFRQIHMQTG